MRRLAAALVALLTVAAAAVTIAAAGDDGGYRVRAIFDNASSASTGSEVRIAGAPVGVVDEIDVTNDDKAALVLAIDDEGFTPFHADARCTIRPQSLIGERYVDCDPGSAGQPELATIESGEGEGERLLPLRRTSSPVDLDLINSIWRLPYRERLTILLDELGAGLAGRGADLRELIHRANPALRETDRVLAILARQNRVLARLAVDADRALGPVARDTDRVVGFIRNATATGQATAERSAEIEAGIRELPGFLRQLRPLMADLGDFAAEGAPVARDLRAAAPGLSRAIAALGPFSSAATPSLVSLGRALETGRPALLETRPLIRDLGAFARQARPLSTNLDRLTASFDRTGGIERFADYLFFQTLAINGFDGIGHYLRAGLTVNLCALYATVPATGCSANFTAAGPSAAATGLAPRLAATPAAAATDGATKAGAADRDAPDALAPTPEGAANVERIRRGAERGSPALDEVADPLLDYLLGERP